VSRRAAPTRSPGLVIAIALTYATVILCFFAAGYLVGRLIL
jgi:hypothetical protein